MSLVACPQALMADSEYVSLPQGDMACSVIVTPTQLPPDEEKKEKSETDKPKPEAEKGKTDANAPKPQPRPDVLKTVEITRIGKMRHDILTAEDGSTFENWYDYVNGLLAHGKLNGSSISSPIVISLGAHVDDYVGAFAPKILDLTDDSLSWVNQQAFKGKTLINGKTAFRYQKTYKVGGTVISDPKTGALKMIGGDLITFQAWIDPKTKVPIALDDSQWNYVLTFSAPVSTTPLVLPAVYKKIIQAHIEATVVPKHR